MSWCDGAPVESCGVLKSTLPLPPLPPPPLPPLPSGPVGVEWGGGVVPSLAISEEFIRIIECYSLM